MLRSIWQSIKSMYSFFVEFFERIHREEMRAVESLSPEGRARYFESRARALGPTDDL